LSSTDANVLAAPNPDLAPRRYVPTIRQARRAQVGHSECVNFDYTLGGVEPTAEAIRRAPGLASKVVGLDEDDARSIVENGGCTFRVMLRDGTGIWRGDLRSNRVSVVIEHGKVTSAQVG
jgi:hypothetical protein